MRTLAPRSQARRQRRLRTLDQSGSGSLEAEARPAGKMPTCPPHGRSSFTLGQLRKRRRGGPRPAPLGQGRDPRQPDRAAARAGRTLFPGIIGYDDTVVPQIVNAILSRHNFILLGLRGQAKSRILRALTDLLDEAIPVVPGCEIHDDPLAPLCAACRARVAAGGRRAADRLARPRRALRREAGDAGRDDCRHDRRPRSDQGGARRPAALRRADDALRAAAAGQPRHLRDQRAAGPRRQDPGRPVQHPPGRRRPDQRLPGAAAARRHDGRSAPTPRTTPRAARSSRR